ncbi:MAG: dTDP-4-dehydrorhamnose reductase [bacterium]|nr:dTDP-4-dehydrorhamnose reductase [bacterium]
MKAKILITGADGQLGKEIQKIGLNYPNFSFIFTDVNELDIVNIKSLKGFFSENKIDFIINCAAYTNVDGAENEISLAEKINIKGPENLAEISNEYNCPLIHISTDYVYGGEVQAVPYKETDLTKPVSFYGKTKLKGEEKVKKANEYVIVRTSWLYSSFGNNFVKTMIRLGNERQELNVIFDQIGTPTYAGDLAESLLEIVWKRIENKTSPLSGVYNFSNEGVCSWYDFAVEIMDFSQIDCKVYSIETKDYPTPAERPHFSVLNKNKIKTDFGIKIPHWRKSLKKCISEINN